MAQIPMNVTQPPIQAKKSGNKKFKVNTSAVNTMGTNSQVQTIQDFQQDNRQNLVKPKKHKKLQNNTAPYQHLDDHDSAIEDLEKRLEMQINHTGGASSGVTGEFQYQNFEQGNPQNTNGGYQDFQQLHNSSNPNIVFNHGQGTNGYSYNNSGEFQQ